MTGIVSVLQCTPAGMIPNYCSTPAARTEAADACSYLYSPVFTDCRNVVSTTLRKHAYSNILIILPPKIENFQIIIFDIFHISAQNIDCGYSLELPRRGGSNEYPQSML